MRDVYTLQPLALVAWGCRLLMSDVNAREVFKFIRKSSQIST